MFKKFFNKLAGKASLDNIRMDLGELRRAFPLDPMKSSKLIFKISDQMCFAFANSVPPSDVKGLIDQSCQGSSEELRQIMDCLYGLNTARFQDDPATALTMEQEMKEIFSLACGYPLDYQQRTLLQKLS